MLNDVTMTFPCVRMLSLLRDNDMLTRIARCFKLNFQYRVFLFVFCHFTFC
jgi:hypothetical protein